MRDAFHRLESIPNQTSMIEKSAAMLMLNCYAFVQQRGKF